MIDIVIPTKYIKTDDTEAIKELWVTAAFGIMHMSRTAVRGQHQVQAFTQ